MSVKPNPLGFPVADKDAKADVKTVLEQLGWDTADMGTVEAARAIEPLCMVISGAAPRTHGTRPRC